MRRNNLEPETSRFSNFLITTWRSKCNAWCVMVADDSGERETRQGFQPRREAQEAGEAIVNGYDTPGPPDSPG
jgi:hypothetical protein